MPRLLPTLPPPPAFSWSSPIPTNLFHGFNLRSRSNLSALCFHDLTNPFSRKPFDFTSMQIPRGCAPFSLLSVSVSLWRSKFVALCFHILTNCFSRLPARLLAGKPFVLTTIRIARGCGDQIRGLPPFFSVRSVSRWQIHSFHTIANSLFVAKRVICLGISNFRTLLQKHPGWGAPIHSPQNMGSRSRFSKRVHNPRVIRPCGALRRGHEPSVTPIPSGTATYERRPYASLCAARRTCRASPSLAHVLSFRLRFECFLWERLISRREPLQERTVDGKGCRTKGTTNP
jgi:hypothetical protein